MDQPHIEKTQRMKDMEDYIRANRAKCPSGCGLNVLWCRTPRGARIPIDFPDQILHGQYPKTHELVPTYGEAGFLGEVEAWPCPTSKATHTVHFDTCEKRQKVKTTPRRRAAE